MTKKLCVHDKATRGPILCQYGCTSVIVCMQPGKYKLRWQCYVLLLWKRMRSWTIHWN